MKLVLKQCYNGGNWKGFYKTKSPKGIKNVVGGQSPECLALCLHNLINALLQISKNNE